MNIRKVGKLLMTCGASMFLAGCGINITLDILEKHENNKIINNKKHENEIIFERENNEAKNAKILAEAEREKEYKLRLQKMSDKEFAKHHAEAIARANEEVIANAERIRKESEAAIVTARLECTEKINKINAECLEKVERAQKEAEEARRKYDEIDKLFTNKNDILKAKRELEYISEKTAKMSSEKEETLNKINLILN